MRKDKCTALLCVAAAFAAAQSGGALLIWIFGSIDTSFEYNILLNIVCVLCVNAAAFMLVCGRIKLPERSGSYSRFEPFAFGFAAVFAACTAAMLSGLLFRSQTDAGNIKLYEGGQLGLYAVYTVVLAPIAEELAFRGAALSRLSKAFGKYGAAAVSALLFALYHWDVTVLAYTFVLGFFLAVIAWRSGSVLPSIIVHAVNNLLTLLVGYFDELATAADIAVPILGAASAAWLILSGRLFKCSD